MKKYVTYEVMFAIDDDSLSAGELEEQIWSNDWKGAEVINTEITDSGEIDGRVVIL